MVSKTSRNKREKELSLYAAAYNLFINQGINKTSISQIAKEAGVGKGTFYLYFEDKYDILDQIILWKSSEVLCEAIVETNAQEFKNFEEELLFFIDYIIEFFKKNKLMLKLIHKNLSWGILKRAMKDYDEINQIYHMFERGYRNKNISKAKIEGILFIILELIGSVLYSSIILEEPDDIDEIKPLLFETIIKIV